MDIISATEYAVLWIRYLNCKEGFVSEYYCDKFNLTNRLDGN